MIKNIVSNNAHPYVKIDSAGFVMVCICNEHCEGTINLNELQDRFNSKLLLHVKDKNGKVIPLWGE